MGYMVRFRVWVRARVWGRDRVRFRVRVWDRVRVYLSLFIPSLLCLLEWSLLMEVLPPIALTIAFQALFPIELIPNRFVNCVPSTIHIIELECLQR